MVCGSLYLTESGGANGATGGCFLTDAAHRLRLEPQRRRTRVSRPVGTGADPPLLGVLRGALRILVAGLRGGTGRLLSAERGKLTTRLAKARDEAAELRSFRGFLQGGSLSGHGGLAGEDELRNVGEGDGVAAGDALAGQLPDEIAKEKIDLIGGSETVDVSEKFGGEHLGIDNGNGGAETVGVVGAESRAVRAVRVKVILVDQHVAALAFEADVLALVIDGGVDCCDGLSRHG